MCPSLGEDYLLGISIVVNNEDFKKNSHFDVNNYPHILYNNAEELKNLLMKLFKVEEDFREEYIGSIPNKHQNAPYNLFLFRLHFFTNKFHKLWLCNVFAYCSSNPSADGQ